MVAAWARHSMCESALRGNDRLSQNAGNQLSTSAAQRHKTAKASFWHNYRGQTMVHSWFQNCVRWHFFKKLANRVDVIILGSVPKLVWSRQNCVHEAFFMNIFLSNHFKLKCKTLHEKRPFINVLTVFLSLIPVRNYEHISFMEFWGYVWA